MRQCQQRRPPACRTERRSTRPAVDRPLTPSAREAAWPAPPSHRRRSARRPDSGPRRSPPAPAVVPPATRGRCRTRCGRRSPGSTSSSSAWDFAGRRPAARPWRRPGSLPWHWRRGPPLSRSALPWRAAKPHHPPGRTHRRDRRDARRGRSRHSRAAEYAHRCLTAGARGPAPAWSSQPHPPLHCRSRSPAPAPASPVARPVGR